MQRVSRNVIIYMQVEARVGYIALPAPEQKALKKHMLRIQP